MIYCAKGHFFSKDSHSRLSVIKMCNHASVVLVTEAQGAYIDISSLINY